MTYQQFNVGDVLTADDVQNIMDQTTIHVASAAARAAVPALDGTRVYQLDNETTYIAKGGAWQRIARRATTFAPVLTNFTAGAAVLSAWYQITDGFCEGEVVVTLGSGSAMGAGPALNLPVPAAVVADGIPAGQAIYTKAGTGYFRGRLMLNSAGRIGLMWEPGNATFFSPVGATDPFGWAANDSARLQFRYKVAA